MEIVPTDINYNYSLMRQNLILLNHTYPFLNIQTVGNSVLGKNIYVIKLGRGTKKVFYSRCNSCKWMDYKCITYEIYWKLRKSISRKFQTI